MVERVDMTLRETFEAYEAFRAKYDDLAARAEPYVNDPTIGAGTKAAIRTSLNAALACGDLFAGLGLASTFSATALKGASKADKALKWLRVPLGKTTEGFLSTLAALDLTPDVKLRTSLGFQFLELASVGILPMRSIEGLKQMNHDVPRVWNAYKRIREIAAAKAEIAPDVRAAIDVFQPEGGNV